MIAASIIQAASGRLRVQPGRGRSAGRAHVRGPPSWSCRPPASGPPPPPARRRSVGPPPSACARRARSCSRAGGGRRARRSAARCVTHSTCRPSAARPASAATTDATRPPMPASTSSKTSVGTRSARARTDLSASIVRDSSPPEATRARAFASSPGLVDSRNSTRSAPRAPTSPPPAPAPTSNTARSMPSARSARSTWVASRPAAVWRRRRRARWRRRPARPRARRAPVPASASTSSWRSRRSSSRRGLVAEAQHRLLAVAVLALEAGERVEPLVDRVQPAGLRQRSRPVAGGWRPAPRRCWMRAASSGSPGAANAGSRRPRSLRGSAPPGPGARPPTAGRRRATPRPPPGRP